MKYEEAMKQLEQIVSEIENGQLDIDLIGEKLRTAQELLKFCRDKLYKTEQEVNGILAPASSDAEA